MHKAPTLHYRPTALPILNLVQAAHRAVLADALTALDQAAARLGRLEEAIQAELERGPLAPLLGALQCLRGVGLVTAATLVAELGDLRRFASPRQLMAYAGLVPGEHSSGGRTRRGGITKTGNPTSGGSSWRRPGTTATRRGWGRRCAAARPGSRRR